MSVYECAISFTKVVSATIHYPTLSDQIMNALCKYVDMLLDVVNNSFITKLYMIVVYTSFAFKSCDQMSGLLLFNMYTVPVIIL